MTRPPPVPEARTRACPAHHGRSAVANLNAGPENDYLCDGLTEELITRSRRCASCA